MVESSDLVDDHGEVVGNVIASLDTILQEEAVTYMGGVNHAKDKRR